MPERPERPELPELPEKPETPESRNSIRYNNRVTWSIWYNDQGHPIFIAGFFPAVPGVPVVPDFPAVPGVKRGNL